MAELFANDAYTTLNGAVNNSVTSIVVTDAALFPSSGDFRIRIDDEFMLVTGVAGSTWTVTRAAEGMGVALTGTSASHANGAEVRHVLTRDAIGALGGGGGGGILIPELLLPEDDNFQETAMDAKWTRVQSGTSKGTWTVGSGLLSWYNNVNGGSELDVWAQSDSISVGDYVQVGFRQLPGTAWNAVWIGFSNSGTWNNGTQVGSWIHWTGANHVWMLNTYVNFQGRTQDGTISTTHPAGFVYHLRVKYESSNTWGLYWSSNGRTWTTVQSNYSRTMTPTHLLLGSALLNPTASTINIFDFYYFRKNAVAA